ncbi:MAG: polyprenyl synthetase family protein [Dehalococcoidia bacterium]
MSAGVPDAFHRYREALDGTLRSLLTSRDPDRSGLLYRMLRYHLGWEDAEGRPSEGDGGKALRPTLCLLACEATGGDWRKALPAAAAVELTHNFSLVHDDIQDRDPERRHRPSVWAVWGEAQAINAGDALAGLARLAVLELRAEGLTEGGVIEAARALDEATLEMVEGQTLDLSFEDRLDVSEAEYLAMVEKKTGALFGCALRLGGLAGSDDGRIAAVLGELGRRLGVAFQIRDDVLGVWGEPASTGKARATDVWNRKKSLPVVYALSRAEGGELRRVYAKAELSGDDVEAALAALDSAGARQYCEAALTERRQQALAALDGVELQAGPARELREVVEYLLAPI